MKHFIYIYLALVFVVIGSSILIASVFDNVQQKVMNHLITTEKVEIKVDKSGEQFYVLKDSSVVNLFKYLNEN